MRGRFRADRVAPAAGLVLVAWLLVPAAAARAGEEEFGDSFTIDTQDVTDVHIDEDNWMGLRYRLRGVPVAMLAAAHRVRSVRYGAAPDELASALDALEAGRHEQAAGFAARLPSVQDKKIAQYVHMVRLEAARGLGQADKMRAAADALIRMGGAKFQSRFLPDALLAAAEADRMEGKYAEARELYEKARKGIEALKGKIPSDPAYAGNRPLSGHLDHLVQTARLRKTECLARQAAALEQKDPDRAREVYRQAESDYRAVQTASMHQFADVYAGARLGVGRCLIARGKFEEAREHVGRLIQDCRDEKSGRVKNRALLGPAHALLGDAHYANKDLWRARFEYLRVTVLYPEDRETVAYCYYRAGVCSEDLATAGKDPKAGQDAKQYWTAAAERFKGTRWAREAAKKLAGGP